ncbi:hypothetical protein DIPPA_06733 [Diplonema papillatum]|nr:hypothetical protein DIPPA_06733 [Diplonema papillatum]
MLIHVVHVLKSTQCSRCATGGTSRWRRSPPGAACRTRRKSWRSHARRGVGLFFGAGRRGQHAHRRGRSGEYVCVYGTSTAAERGLLFYYGPKQAPSAGFLEEPLELVLLVAFVSVSVCLISLITVGVMWTNTWNHANDDDDDDDDGSEPELAGRQSGYNKLTCNTAAVEMQEELSVVSPSRGVVP